MKDITLDNKELAINVGDLYYDALADFLKELSEKIESDGNADHARGRTKLAKELHDCAANLEQAATHIDKAWEICLPHVTAWKNKQNHKD